MRIILLLMGNSEMKANRSLQGLACTGPEGGGDRSCEQVTEDGLPYGSPLSR